jgi:Sortase domain
MIAAGAVLAGISVSQHQHHDHALAVYAARKAQVDRATVLEARQFQAQQSRTTAGPRAHPATVSDPANPGPVTKAKPSRAAAVVLTVDNRATARVAGRHPQAAATPRSGVVTGSGAVSEIRGSGAKLVIPALGVNAPVVATGAVDGSMTIPGDVHTVGWYNGTDTTGGRTVSVPEPWPGQPGVSLLAGHINWVGQGPGALYYIGQLVVGDPLEVIGSNRVATYWRVSQPPITLPKVDLPDNLFVNTGPPKLALVTCGGPYDPATHHYLDNVVVWATPAAL